MSAGVTTTHDKYPPFTRAELQAIRDRAERIGAQLVDPHAARAHLDLAQAADHLDAIRARAGAKPDLKLYDPNADTELYEAQSPDGLLGFDAAVPAPIGEPEPDDVRRERDTDLGFASAGPGLLGEPADDSDGALRRVAERVRGRVVDRIARRHGASHAAVGAALAEVTRDRPLWQWLRDGGLERLIALVVSLLPLFV